MESFAEAVGVAISVTATEESDLLTREILLCELGEEVFPVVLEITQTPSGGAEEEDIEASDISSVSACYIEYVCFCTEGLSQALSYLRGGALQDRM